MRRDHIYRLRLGDAERDDLGARAAAEGIAKADVIREAMGWEPEGLIRPGSAAKPASRPPAPADAANDPGDAAGPGTAAVSELARRIQERKSRG